MCGATGAEPNLIATFVIASPRRGRGNPLAIVRHQGRARGKCRFMDW